MKQQIKRRRTANGNVIYTAVETNPTHRIIIPALVGLVAGSGFLTVGFFLVTGNILNNILP